MPRALEWTKDIDGRMRGSIGLYGLGSWFYTACSDYVKIWNPKEGRWEDICEFSGPVEDAMEICEVHYATGA